MPFRTVGPGAQCDGSMGLSSLVRIIRGGSKVGLWGPHHVVDGHYFHLGQRYGTPSWLSRLWSPARAATPCDPTVVPPADYVELRSLGIAKEELEAELARSGPRRGEVDTPRPWPFRWPTSGETVVPPPLPEPDEQPKGQYLDIYA